MYWPFSGLPFYLGDVTQRKGGRERGKKRRKERRKEGRRKKKKNKIKKRYKENDIHTFLNATIYLSPSSPNAIEVKLYVMHVSCVTERWFASIISK